MFPLSLHYVGYEVLGDKTLGNINMTKSQARAKMLTMLQTRKCFLCCCFASRSCIVLAVQLFTGTQASQTNLKNLNTYTHTHKHRYSMRKVINFIVLLVWTTIL